MRQLNRQLNGQIEDIQKEGRKAIRSAREEGIWDGGIAATAAVLGTIAVDRILLTLAPRWPWVKTYRKWIDLAIGVVILGLGYFQGWTRFVLAGLVWLAIQIFLRLANMTGLASGFSVEGVGDEASELDDADLALVGAALAGLEDDATAYHVAEVAEVGVLPAAAAMAIPALLKLAQEYGPGAVQAVQKMINAAKAGRKRPGAKTRVLDARPVAQAQRAALLKAGVALPPAQPPAPALPSGQERQEMLTAFSDALRQELQTVRSEFGNRLQELHAQQAATAATQTELTGLLEESAGFRRGAWAGRPRRVRLADTETATAPATTETATAPATTETATAPATDTAAAFNQAAGLASF